MTPDQTEFLIFLTKGTAFGVGAITIIMLGIAIVFTTIGTVVHFGVGYGEYLDKVDAKAMFQKLFSNMWWTRPKHAIRSLLRSLVSHKTLFTHKSDLCVLIFQGKQISQCGYEQIKNHVQYLHRYQTQVHS